MSFRARIALVSATAVALAIVVASIVVYFVVRGQLLSSLDDTLRDRASDPGRASSLGPMLPRRDTSSLYSRTELAGLGQIRISPAACP